MHSLVEQEIDTSTEVVASIADAYIALLVSRASPLTLNRSSIEQRRTRATLIVSDVIRSLGHPAPALPPPAASETETTLGYFRAGIPAAAAVEASGIFFEIALEQLSLVLPDRTECIAATLMKRMLADVTAAAECLQQAGRKRTETEVVDEVRLRAILTGRERAVFDLLVANTPIKEMAAALDISEHTVKHHVTSIGRKFGARGRYSVRMKARELGVLVAVPALAIGSTIADGVAQSGLL